MESVKGRLDHGPALAVIDIGSNSVRLVIYEGLTRSPTPIFNEKVLAGLGRQVQTTGLLAQDAIVWVAQGPIVDRSQETLGRTDIPIVVLRRQLQEQIALVEQGKTPINFFPEKSPDILYGRGAPPDDWTAPDWASRQLKLSQSFRMNFHKGFHRDDADRYGPAVGLVQELHRRIDEAKQKAANLAE